MLSYLSEKDLTSVTGWPGLVTYKTLWPPATSNCGSLRPQICSPVTQECCALQPQQTMAASGGKFPYVIMEVVTKDLT